MLFPVSNLCKQVKVNLRENYKKKIQREETTVNR